SVCGACGRICTPLPGGFGHQPAGTMAGAGGASLDWDRQRRVTPAVTAYDLRPRVGAAVRIGRSLLRPRKHGLKQNLGDESPLGTEPRWDADRRARSDERAPCPYGTEMKTCVCRRSASLFN